MSALNSFNTITTPMLERLLAIKQIKHYLHLQQSAIDTDDIQEFHRVSNIIDCLTIEYGEAALFEAEDEML